MCDELRIGQRVWPIAVKRYPDPDEPRWEVGMSYTLDAIARTREGVLRYGHRENMSGMLCSDDMAWTTDAWSSAQEAQAICDQRNKAGAYNINPRRLLSYVPSAPTALRAEVKAVEKMAAAQADQPFVYQPPESASVLSPGFYIGIQVIRGNSDLRVVEMRMEDGHPTWYIMGWDVSSNEPPDVLLAGPWPTEGEFCVWVLSQMGEPNVIKPT